MKKLRWMLGVALVLASALFLGRQVLRDWEQVRDIANHVNGWSLAVSVVLQGVVLVLGAALWGRVLSRMTGAGEPPVVHEVVRIWSVSQLARYVPGMVWPFVAAARLGADVGMPRAPLLITLAVHTGFSVVAASMVAVLLGPMPWLAVPLVALVHPWVIDRCVSLVARVSGSTPVRWNGGLRASVEQLLLTVGIWLASGGSFWMMLGAVMGADAVGFAQAVHAHAAGFVAGQVALPAPGGLGVREVALALLLQPRLGPGVAATVGAFSRLWSVAAELLVAGVVLTLERRTP